LAILGKSKLALTADLPASGLPPQAPSGSPFRELPAIQPPRLDRLEHLCHNRPLASRGTQPMHRDLVNMNSLVNKRAPRSALPSAPSTAGLGLTRRQRLAPPYHPDAAIEPQVFFSSGSGHGRSARGQKGMTSRGYQNNRFGGGSRGKGHSRVQSRPRRTPVRVGQGEGISGCAVRPLKQACKPSP
jgi:hypothetical protein